MEKIRKNKRGITLVALIITIIILMILAGIAIASLGGENGLFARAREARNKTEEAQDKENEILNQLYDEMNGIDTSPVARIGNMEYQTLQDAIDAVPSSKSFTTEIVMLRNTNEIVNNPFNKNTYLNLNNKTIVGTIYNYGEITINNGTIINKGICLYNLGIATIEGNTESTYLEGEHLENPEISYEEESTIYNDGSKGFGILYVKGGRIIGNDNNTCIHNTNKARFVMNDGKVEYNGSKKWGSALKFQNDTEEDIEDDNISEITGGNIVSSNKNFHTIQIRNWKVKMTGCKIENNNDSSSLYLQGGEVEIGTNVELLNVSENSKPTILIQRGGNLVIDGGKVFSEGTSSIVAQNTSNVIIKNADISSDGKEASCVMIDDDSKLELYGGTINYTGTYKYGSAIKLSNNTDSEKEIPDDRRSSIKGGIVKSSNEKFSTIQIYKKMKLNIEGGTIINSSSKCNAILNQGKLDILGGTIKGGGTSISFPTVCSDSIEFNFIKGTIINPNEVEAYCYYNTQTKEYQKGSSWIK